MIQEVIENLVKEALDENQDLFLINLNISTDNKITIIVDGDHGVPLKECIRISRHVEHNLDREETDFSLEVTSPGLTTPLSNKRQFIKNIGKYIEIEASSEKLEGKLTAVSEDDLNIEWKVKEPKPVGKGKITVVKSATLKFKDIKQAKVKVIF
jgi:ribosome maturation factor RimP